MRLQNWSLKQDGKLRSQEMKASREIRLIYPLTRRKYSIAVYKTRTDQLSSWTK
jgi:hypothetical protein